MVAGKTWERDAKDLVLGLSSEAVVWTCCQQRQCLVWDLIHTILWGRDLNLSYFIEVLFTYSALCVCLEACRFEPQ